jgi:tetratricopeptide (TPR) repeat protein
MPTLHTFWQGGAEIIPATIQGNVLISAGDLSGCEWPSSRLNPYIVFQPLQPAESIEYGVLVYHGTFAVNRAAALSRVQNAYTLLRQRKAEEALALAREAAALDPEGVDAQSALGNIAALLGQKDEARKAWQAALASARQLEPNAQNGYVPDLEARLKKLSQ